MGTLTQEHAQKIVGVIAREDLRLDMMYWMTLPTEGDYSHLTADMEYPCGTTLCITGAAIITDEQANRQLEFDILAFNRRLLVGVNVQGEELVVDEYAFNLFGKGYSSLVYHDHWPLEPYKFYFSHPHLRNALAIAVLQAYCQITFGFEIEMPADLHRKLLTMWPNYSSDLRIEYDPLL